MYNPSMETSFNTVLNRARATALQGGAVSYQDAVSLSTCLGADLVDLFAAATRVREQHLGNRVDICSIVNAKSGACSEDCSYCAQSSHHATEAPIYPLISVDRMSEAAGERQKERRQKVLHRYERPRDRIS